MYQSPQNTIGNFGLLTTRSDEINELFKHLTCNISLRPYLTYIKKQKEGINDIRSKFYDFIIEQIESRPELLQPIEDMDILEQNADVLELITASVFPIVNTDKEQTFAFGIPFQFSAFYYSDSFYDLCTEPEGDYLRLPTNVSDHDFISDRVSLAYQLIIQKFYQLNVISPKRITFLREDKSTGLKKYYQIQVDTRFVDIVNDKGLPQLSDEAVCKRSFQILNIEKLKQELPLDSFRMEGFTILNINDITVSHVQEQLKDIVLNLKEDNTGPYYLEEVRNALSTLLELNGDHISVFPFFKVNEHLALGEEWTSQSVLWPSEICERESLTDSTSFCKEFEKRLVAPLIFPIITEKDIEEHPFLKQAASKGIQSALLMPVRNQNKLAGIIEIGSSIPGRLNVDLLLKMQVALPTISLLLNKNVESFNSQIDQWIKNKYTPIQPAVEWKFREMAWENIGHHNESMDPDANNIVFSDVYPIYGAIDIRNSSIERSLGIRKDLTEQLNTLSLMLGKIRDTITLPIIDELIYKNDQHLNAISSALVADQEQIISEYLEKEINPVLRHLLKGHPVIAPLINDYFKELNHENGAMHKNRLAYEHSLSSINQVILKYLDKEESIIQRSYPHYFEKYRTDGVEYNIYIGQSIAPQLPFDNIYLKNIRLWQLKSMIAIANSTNSLVPNLQVPLETTQLILIHSTPLDISFRRDEHRFDVEGSYNIRYEIMKKRLDKAYVLNSNERLTQPGKIAIVYGNPREAKEYKTYLQFFQHQGLLAPDIEELELEALQGIDGLKALRATIIFQDQNLKPIEKEG